jgi:hypothetical protein
MTEIAGRRCRLPVLQGAARTASAPMTGRTQQRQPLNARTLCREVRGDQPAKGKANDVNRGVLAYQQVQRGRQGTHDGRKTTLGCCIV